MNPDDIRMTVALGGYFASIDVSNSRTARGSGFSPASHRHTVRGSRTSTLRAKPRTDWPEALMARDNNSASVMSALNDGLAVEMTRTGEIGQRASDLLNAVEIFVAVRGQGVKAVKQSAKLRACLSGSLKVVGNGAGLLGVAMASQSGVRHIAILGSRGVIAAAHGWKYATA